MMCGIVIISLRETKLVAWLLFGTLRRSLFTLLLGIIVRLCSVRVALPRHFFCFLFFFFAQPKI